MRFALIAIVILLSGCAASHTVPHASGPVFALNPGVWTPLPSDLTMNGPN